MEVGRKVSNEDNGKRVVLGEKKEWTENETELY